MIHNDLDLCHVQNHIVYRYAFDIMMEMCGQFFSIMYNISIKTVNKLDLNINTQKLNHEDSSL